jgi:hypothetical protein
VSSLALRVLGTVGLMAAAFVAGTVAHEAVHVVAVHAVGGDVDHVHWLPPKPAVVFDADARGTALVRVAPVAVTVPLVAAGVWLLRDQPLETQAAGAVLLAAFIPRSDTDWQPVVNALVPLFK